MQQTLACKTACKTACTAMWHPWHVRIPEQTSRLNGSVCMTQVQSRRHEDGSRGGSIKPGFCFLNHDPGSAPLFG